MLLVGLVAYLGHMTIQSTSAAGAIPGWTMGDRLRKAREYAGMSQMELSELIGASKRTIGRYEDGAEPKRPVVISWALATGVSLDWLETGELNEKTPSPGGDGVSSNEPPAGFEPATFSLQLIHFEQEEIAA